MPTNLQAGLPPRSFRGRATSAGKGVGAGTRKASDALVEAVGGLADQAIDRMLLSGEHVTSAAQGRRLLAGEADTEAIADNIQRVVVLAVPVVRVLARAPFYPGAMGDGCVELRLDRRRGPHGRA